MQLCDIANQAQGQKHKWSPISLLFSTQTPLKFPLLLWQDIKLILPQQCASASRLISFLFLLFLLI